MCNMKAVLFIIRNYDHCNFFFKNRSRSKGSVPTERSYSKEYSCEI